ncbi:hypothetical protein KOR34_23250 [Posidoniimonas corsicana]|uniref:Uncharacterized protein n=1 Tax=Posidoniimonas corsicana TaxID=1938618 RepID=A0A5C5VHZ3_9BACT|nr:hypothetical protein KOR34_23250 [Posidoniimonas corsicana]
MLANIASDVDSLIAVSLAYFESVKQQRSIAYIDDLSDPHIVCSQSDFSIYWSSAAGERNGDGTIAIDFDGRTRTPVGLTLAD